MDRAQFERALRKLVEEHEAQPTNRGCVQCVGCERCVDSTFCRDSRELVRCHYCIHVVSSVDCTHCRDALGLSHCSHCLAVERCSNSAYLSYCTDCTGCQYCFGCVGLSGAEFRILNEQVDRSTFFKRTDELVRTLGGASLPDLRRGARQGRR